MQPLGGVWPVFARRHVFREGDGVRDFIGSSVEGRGQAVRFEHGDKASVQRGDAAELERQQVALAVADVEDDGMAGEIEGQSKNACVRGDRLDRQPFGDRMERRVPAVIDPRGMRDPELAEHLAGEVQRGEGRTVAGRVEFGPVGHVHALCILQRGIARAARPWPTI